MSKQNSSFKKHLTKTFKKSIIYLEDSVPFVWLQKQFRTIRKVIVIKSPSKFFSNPAKLFGKPRRIAMKKKFMQNRGHFVTFLGIVFVSASLVACGGGGGGGTSSGTTTPTVFSSTGKAGCLIDPDKNSVSVTATGATQAEADANAAALALAKAKEQCTVLTGSISVADGVSVDALFANGFSTTTPGPMQVANVDNVKLVIGATEVGATVPLTLSNFTPTSFLNKLTAKPAPGRYTYVANLFDGLDRPFKFVKTFTVVPTTTVCAGSAMLNSFGMCMPPPAAIGYTWNTANKVWVADIGTLVTGLNTLPAECVTVGDACWKASSANGTIKYFASNMAISNGRKLVFGGFIIGGSSRVSGYFNMVPIYADTEADTPGLDKGLDPGALSGGFVSGKGSEAGVKFTTPNAECREKFFDGNGITSHSVSCPI